MKRQQDKLLIIIAMSGEMPTYLGQYVTGSISYTAALITRLKKERYISLRCKDGYRGYVLLEKGRNYLLSEYEKVSYQYVTDNLYTDDIADKEKLNAQCLQLYVQQVEKAAESGAVLETIVFVPMVNDGYYGWNIIMTDDLMKNVLGNLQMPVS